MDLGTIDGARLPLSKRMPTPQFGSPALRSRLLP